MKENLALVHGINGVKHALPIEPTCYELDDTNPANQKEFRQITRVLLYIAQTTPPEISIHVNLLERRTTALSTRNLQTAKDIYQYLLSTKSERLYLNPTKDSGLEVKIIVYGSSKGEEARSQIAMTANQPVTWYSQRQGTESLSITEAEYIACSEGAKDASWTRQFLNTLPLMVQTQFLSIIYTYNKAANKISKNYAYRRRTRYIDHTYHHVRQEARRGNMKTKGISGKNSADEALTNKLPQSIERNNWPNQISTESISVGQYAIDLATPITTEEQNWVDKFIIAAD
jgi:hypothetical protein